MAILTETHTNTAVFGDCIPEMRGFGNGFFHLANVDPPYFSGPEKRGFYGNRHSAIQVKRRDYDKTDTWQLPGKEYFDGLFRVSENQIIWGANYFSFRDVSPFKTPRRAALPDFMASNPRGWIIWDKCNGNTDFNDVELAWSSFNEPTYVYRFLWNGMMQGASENTGWIQQGNKQLNQKRIHPTEKPVKLYRYLLNRYTRPGMRVLDTHLGSGSHRLAALDFPVAFHGIEKNRIHFDNQEKRFLQHSGALRLDFGHCRHQAEQH